MEPTSTTVTLQNPVFSDKLVNLIYATLIAMAPVDTGNMKTNIKLYYYGTQGGDVIARIVVSPGVPYAARTNYWNYPSPYTKSGKPSKQYYNWQWADKSIRQACVIVAEQEGVPVTGGVIDNGRNRQV